MFAFGKVFNQAWSGATDAAKGAAAAIATGAKAVGQIPVLAAYAEAQVLRTVESGRDVLEMTAAKAKAGLSIEVDKWKNWMDVKNAQVMSVIDKSIDPNAVRQTGDAGLAASIRQQQAKIGNLAADQKSRVAALESANQRRIVAAEGLRAKIAAAGVTAGNRLVSGMHQLDPAVAKLGEAADRMALDALGNMIGGALKAVGTGGKAWGIVKDQFSRTVLGVPAEPCPLSPPGMRLAQNAESRQRLVKQALERARSLPPGKERARLETTAASLQKTVDASEALLLADDAYPGSESRKARGDAPPPGFRRVADDADKLKELHLQKSLFRPQDSGFRAELYESENQPGHYVLAFKGTSPDSGEDWQNNLLQNYNIKSDYYERAELLTARVKESIGDNASLTVTGHSLAGGMATASGMSVPGVNVIAFNPSGLNPGTVVGFDAEEARKNVQVYRVPGEALDVAQNTGLMVPAPGTLTYLDDQPQAGMVEKHLTPALMTGVNDLGHQEEARLRGWMPGAATATP